MTLPLATQYKEEVFKPMTKTIKRIGEALGPRVSPKAVDISPYQGVADTVQSKIPKTIPRGVRDIGTVTVQPGGRTRYEKVHPGIDIANIVGTGIPSFTGGRVSDIVTGEVKGSPGFGNYVIVTDEQGNRHRYSHLSQNYVKVGDPVYAGMPLGAMGVSGQVYSTHPQGSGSHLDYRIKNVAGKYLDPYTFIK